MPTVTARPTRTCPGSRRRPFTPWPASMGKAPGGFIQRRRFGRCSGWMCGLGLLRVTGIHLGIDYGTSNTVAVLRWPDGRGRTLLFDSSPLLPSAVFATVEGPLLVGRDAERAARADPGRFEPNPKRRID